MAKTNYYIFIMPDGSLRKVKEGNPMYDYEIDKKNNWEETHYFFMEKVTNDHSIYVKTTSSNKRQKCDVKDIPTSKKYARQGKNGWLFFDTKNKNIVKVVLELK